MDAEKTKARIDARRWAEECYMAVEDQAAFAERVDELHNGIPEPPPKAIPMTDAEARAFEDMTIWFGVHKSHRIGDVPIEYLQRLTDPPGEKMQDFLQQIKRYLTNATIARQLAEE